MKKYGFTLFKIMISLAIIGVLAIGIVSSRSVSDGVRKGSVTKFSSKGIFWKSYEGQLVMGGRLPPVPLHHLVRL